MSIKSGYFKKFLHVDLTTERCDRTELKDEFLERYIGGRGFGAKMVWDNLVKHDYKIDPLGPENLLIIAPGPLTGLYLPSSGKCSRMRSGVSKQRSWSWRRLSLGGTRLPSR